MSNIFISYAKEDVATARWLFNELKGAGLEPWLDEVSLGPGERWAVAIRKAIRDSRFFLALLSSRSTTKRGYVQREIRQALKVLDEFPDDQVYVIPIRLDQCVPTHEQLKRLQWLDLFPDRTAALGKLLRRLKGDSSSADRVETVAQDQVEPQESSESAAPTKLKSAIIVLLAVAVTVILALMAGWVAPTEDPTSETNLAEATNKAMQAGVGILGQPFHRPFQYIGMPIAEAAKAVAGTPNEAGNIVIDTDRAHMLLESEGNFVSYVDVEFKTTRPCSQTKGFDSESILGAVSINPSELELARKQAHFHTYYDHQRKLKVGVACLVDGGALSIGFSSKYYGS